MRKSQIHKFAWCITLLLTAVAFFPCALSAQQQTNLASSTQTEYYYTVQKGDTLWDISQKFFNDAELWPDLWGQNETLTNPHWIYPGDMLHIFIRDGKVYVEKVTETVAEPETPPAEPYFLYAPIAQVGFIKNPAVQASGAIFKLKDDLIMAGLGDTVYIRNENAARFSVGDQLTIFRKIANVSDPVDPEQNLGVQHYLTGVVEVTRQEDGYCMAEIVQSYRHIEVGDLAMPYEEVSNKIIFSDATPNIEGAIVLSEEHTDLIGEQDIAFIDKGTNDGVRNGQRYKVFGQDAVSLMADAEDATLLPPVELGTILVLRTEADTATVLVLDSDQEFSAGTKFSTTLN